MGKYLIELSFDAEAALSERAQRENSTPERIAEDILNTMLVRPHNMNEKDMEKGYRDWGEINLNLSK